MLSVLYTDTFFFTSRESYCGGYLFEKDVAAVGGGGGAMKEKETLAACSSG